MPYQQVYIKAINHFQNGYGVAFFLSGVIDEQYMDTRGWGQWKTLVSLRHSH